MLTLSKILPREEEETLIQGLSLVKEKVNILWSDLINKYLVTTSTEVYLVDSINEIIPKIMSADADNIPDNNKIPIFAASDPYSGDYMAVVFDDSTGEVYGYVFDTDLYVLNSTIITSNSGIIGNSRNAIVAFDPDELSFFEAIIYPNRLQELSIDLFSGEARLLPSDGYRYIAHEPTEDIYIDSHTHLNMDGDDILSGRTILYVGNSETILPTYIGETLVLRNEPSRLIFLAEDLGKDSLSLFIVEYVPSEESYHFETTVSYVPLGRGYYEGPEPPPIDYKLSDIRSITNVIDGEVGVMDYHCRILFDNPPYVLEGKIPLLEPKVPLIVSVSPINPIIQSPVTHLTESEYWVSINEDYNGDYIVDMTPRDGISCAISPILSQNSFNIYIYVGNSLGDNIFDSIQGGVEITSTNIINNQYTEYILTISPVSEGYFYRYYSYNPPGWYESMIDEFGVTIRTSNFTSLGNVKGRFLCISKYP